MLSKWLFLLAMVQLRSQGISYFKAWIENGEKMPPGIEVARLYLNILPIKSVTVIVLFVGSRNGF